jgi:hypothetical protein
MKKTLLIAIALLTFAFAKGQNIDSYFQNKGVFLLAGCSHPTGTYQSGTFDGSQSSDFIIVDFKYQDGNETVLKVYRSGIFFSGIDVISDTDYVPPFLALQLVMNIVIEDAKKHNQEDVQKTLAYMKTIFDTDPEQWNGKTWALFALNLDYVSY